MTKYTRLMTLFALTGLCTLARSVSAETAAVAQGQPASVAASTPGAVAQPVPPPGYVLVPVGTAYPMPPASNPEAIEPQQELPYSSGQPVPVGYHVEERIRKGLVIGGSLTLGIPWVFSATAAVANDFEDQSGLLVIPALGPWLMLAAGGADDRDCSNTEMYEYNYCSSSNSALRSILFLDGITQTAGAIMLAAGLAYPTKRLVRDSIAISLVPTHVGVDGFGLGATGTF